MIDKWFINVICYCLDTTTTATTTTTTATTTTTTATTTTTTTPITTEVYDPLKHERKVTCTGWQERFVFVCILIDMLRWKGNINK